MNKIKDEEFGHFAIEIMNIISFFEPADSIPTVIFTENNPENERNYNGAVGILKKYSMVTGEPGKINIPRLVQRVIRININPETVLLQGIGLIIKYMRPRRKNDELTRSLLSHAESLYRHGMKYKTCGEQFSLFPHYTCQKLKYYGRYNAMLQLARDSQAVIQNQLGERNFISIRINYFEAEALHCFKNYAESGIILNRIYLEAKSFLGGEHWLTLTVSNLIAVNLTRQGKHSEALEMYVQ